ncbi:hypothetical protein JCM15519_30090 [Fundidesulfovibrio butyratiphilus]
MKIGSTLTQSSLFGQTATTRLFQGQMALDTKAVDGFAQELTRRAQQGADPQTSQTVDNQGLTQAMTGAVDWVKDTLGSNAARAVMGIVMGSVGNGALSEESLGDGFVKALQFIDNTFGTKIGDQAIGTFNGQLNQALNGYFQNGQDESFLAMDLDTAMSQAGAAMGEVVSQFFKNTQGNTADAGSSLLEGMDKDRREREAEEEAHLEAQQEAKAEAEAQTRDASLEGSGQGAVTDQVQATVQAAARAAQTTAQGSGQGSSQVDTAQSVGDAAQTRDGETAPAADADAAQASEAAQTTGQASAEASDAQTRTAQATQSAPSVSMARVRRLSRHAASLRGYASSSLPTGVVVQATA